VGKGSRVVVDAELDWREWTDEQDKRREAVILRARPVLVGGALEHRQR
jgi:single-stranded DNA-binding protein